MADKQRVHPRTKDLEKNAGEYENQKGSSPLVPKSSLESGKNRVYPPPGGQMRDHYQRDQVIPTHQTPRYHSRPPKRRNSCCRCLCCTICFLFALVAIIVIACGILYLVFQPRIPKYSVDGIRITNFSINADLSTNCQFTVNVRARNPNKKIGIYYLDNSHLAVSYMGTELCTGTLPVFYQGHKNTTVLDVALSRTGARLTSAVVSTLKEQQQKASVPLNLKADVPVKIKLGNLKSMKIKVRVRWDLVVDRLDASAKVITDKSKVSVKL
uniref:Late embryogenesis abundant protein LEA-2 subgroup domain-containing protein n=1 Tax=Picea sitchensis TaxID=3332 RepID=A9NYU7_PICSI|nr:unknown [Picea sitchensis]